MILPNILPTYNMFLLYLNAGMSFFTNVPIRGTPPVLAHWTFQEKKGSEGGRGDAAPLQWAVVVVTG